MQSRWLAIMLVTLFSGCYTSNQPVQPVATTTITYQHFYDNLSPYGTWIDYPGYGNVWSPRLEGEFRPYATNGYWVYSPEGWAWQSSYAWGWAAFHYGRWLYDDNYGWLWIPGYDWSPAWVTWGTTGGYYAWAPLMPEVNVMSDFGAWRPNPFYWNVCSREHVSDRNLSVVMEQPERAVNVVNNITIINNFTTTRGNNLHYSKGPEIDEVQRFTKEKINPVSFKEVNKAEQASHSGDVVNVYRPPVENPHPTEFRRVDKENVKPIRSTDDRPTRKRDEQQNNVQHLPVQKMPNNHSHGDMNNDKERHSNNADDSRGGNNIDRKH